MWPSPISRREIEIRAVVCPSISREYHTLSLFFCGSRFDKGETCPATASGGHGSQSPLMSPPLFEIAYGRNSSTIEKKGGFSLKKREKMSKKYSPEALSFPYIQFKHWGKKKLVKKIVDTVSFWSAETSEKPRLVSYRSRRTYVFRRERERERRRKKGGRTSFPSSRQRLAQQQGTCGVCKYGFPERGGGENESPPSLSRGLFYRAAEAK